VTENTEFAITEGISGSWYLDARSGEGFEIDVARYGDELKFVAT
jgi:hypothetical protein